jgi:eukaryotic-like serine/threonine-protein kinase
MSIDLQRFGKYKLQECLGRGGMAEVWKAFDPRLQRYVALKIFSADLQNDPDFMTRLWSLPLAPEAEAIVSLRHPHIVPVHSFQISHPSESARPLTYMVMDYIEGQSLADYLRNTSCKGAFPSAADIVHLLGSIGAALDYAHQKGVIHGDLKPTNILLDNHNTSRNPSGAVFTAVELSGAVARPPGLRYPLAKRCSNNSCSWGALPT